jgi:cation:H+ antiporter
MSSVLLVVAGLVVLLTGAEVLVRGGTELATWFGITPMLVGLTVVSLGTSVPELAVGIDAAVSGSPGLAVGNIVGTNLVNILFILGLSALLVPVALQARTLRFDLPAMTAAAMLLVVLPSTARSTGWTVWRSSSAARSTRSCWCRANGGNAGESRFLGSRMLPV